MVTPHTASTRNLLLRWCGWLLLSTIAFELVIAARYFGVADFDQGPGSLVFRAVMLLAHFTLVSAVLLAVVLVLGTAASTGLARRSPRHFAFHCNPGRIAHRYAGLSAVSLPYQCRRDESAAGRSGAGNFRLLGFDVLAGRSDRLCDHPGAVASRLGSAGATYCTIREAGALRAH